MMYAIYDSAGEAEALRILRMFTGPADDAAAQCGENEGLAEIALGVAGGTHYIKRSTGQANLRNTTPCTPSRLSVPADGATRLTLSQMRPGTDLLMTGPDSGSLSVPDGGSDTVVFVKPGRYRILAQAPFPALPKEIVIDAA